MKPLVLLLSVLALADASAVVGLSAPPPAAEQVLLPTVLFKPLRNDSKLTLPPTPAGGRWTIEKTVPAGIVAADGTLMVGLNEQDWGVSTESPDGKTVYLHILKPPAGQTLKLGLTEDGSTLIGPAVNLRTGQNATLTAKRMGYELTIPDGETWDPLDTVIRISRR